MGTCQSKAEFEEIIREKDLRINELVSDLDAAKSERTDALAEAEEVNKRLEQEIDKVKNLEEEGKQKDSEIGTLKENTQKLEGELDETRKENESKIMELNEKTEKLETVLDETRKEKDAQGVKLNETNDKLQRTLRESEQQHDEYELQIQQLKASIDQKDRDIAALKSKNSATTGWGFGKKKADDAKLKAPDTVEREKRKNSRSILGGFLGGSSKSNGKDSYKKLGSTSEEPSKSANGANGSPAAPITRKESESEYSSSGYEPLNETPAIKVKSDTKLKSPEEPSSSEKEAGEKASIDTRGYTSEALKGQKLLYVGELAKKNPGGLVGVHLWKTRFCVLTEKAFYYFAKPSDAKPKGTILLAQIRTVAHQPQDARKFGIALNGDDRIYEWKADNDEAVDRWIKAVDEARRDA